MNPAAAIPEEDIEVRKYMKWLPALLLLIGIMVPGMAFSACDCGKDNHVWGEWYNASNGLWEYESGQGYLSVTVKYRDCVKCGAQETKYERQDGKTWMDYKSGKDHNWGEVITTKEATCISNGSRTRTCSVCGKTETSTVLPNNNHQYGEWKVTKDATCTSSGTRTRTCTKCGKTETETIPADGAHTYGEWKIIQEATCTKSGSKTRTCTKCGKTETETIPAGGKNHKYTEWEVIKEPTCTKKGQEMRRCKLCGDLQYKQLPMTDHTLAEWTTIKEANCRQEGKRTGTCSVCGKKVTEKVPKTEHDFEDWVIEIPETDCSMGRRSSTCKLCGKKKVEDYYPEGTLYKGGDNPQNEVEELQEALTALGLYKGKITGEYDNATAEAVKKFEKSVGMKQDGICWPKVKKLLGLGRGASDPISSDPTKGKLKLEAVVNSPRSDDYIPGDQISIQWTLTNTSQRNDAKSVRFYRFTGQKANKSKDLEITQQEALAKGENFSDTYVYTVTPEDVEHSEFVLSFIARCKFGSSNAESNTVRFVFSGSASRESGSGDGSQSLPNDSDGTSGDDSGDGSWSLPDDSDSTSGDDSGDGSWTPPADPNEVPDPVPGSLETGVHICGKVLIAEGEDTIEYEIIECDRHETAASASGRMMEAGNYAGAIQFWNDEIAHLYQDRAETVSDESKRHVEEEQAAFENQMKALEASLRLICSEADATAVVVQERMNHCFSLCYEIYTAPAPRTDSFLGEHTILNGAGDNGTCSQESVSLGSGSVHVISHLCRDHRETLAAVLQPVKSAGSTEEKIVAWQEAQKKWLLALNAMYDKWYLSADKSLRDTIAADRLSFDELVDARRNTLADLYPEDPAAAEEALANMIMERTKLICGLLHTAGILTDAP